MHAADCSRLTYGTLTIGVWKVPARKIEAVSWKVLPHIGRILEHRPQLFRICCVARVATRHPLDGNVDGPSLGGLVHGGGRGAAAAAAKAHDASSWSGLTRPVAR